MTVKQIDAHRKFEEVAPENSVGSDAADDGTNNRAADRDVRLSLIWEPISERLVRSLHGWQKEHGRMPNPWARHLDKPPVLRQTASRRPKHMAWA